jgi:hypothetical protein
VEERLARLDAVTPDAIGSAIAAILTGPAVGVAVGQLGRTARERIKEVVKDPGRPKSTRRSAPPA